MSAIAFEPQAFIKRLATAGMPEAQAEILAEEQAKLIGRQLAARSDLELLMHQLTIRVGAMIAALARVLSGIRIFGH